MIYFFVAVAMIAFVIWLTKIDDEADKKQKEETMRRLGEEG